MSTILHREQAVKNMLGPKKRKWLYGGLAVIIVLGAGGAVANAYMQAPTSNGSTYTVGYGTVVQTVSAAATVQPATTMNLSFSGASGTLQSVSVAIGQQVKAGQVLATLNDTQQAATVAQDQAAVLAAQGNLEQAQAKLTASEQGSTAATIAVAKAGVAKAQAALAGVKQQYQDETAIYNDRTSAQSQLVTAQNTVAQDAVAVQAAEVNLKKVQLSSAAALNGGGTPQDVIALKDVVSTDQQAVSSAQKQLALAQSDLQLLHTNLQTAQQEYGTITQQQVEKAYQAYQTQLSNYVQFQGETTNPQAQNPFSSAMQTADDQYQALNNGYTAVQQAQEQYNAGAAAVQNDQTAVENAQANLATANKNVADAIPGSSTNLAQQAQVSVQAAQVSVTQAQVQDQAAQADLKIAQALYNDRSSAQQVLNQDQNLVVQNQAALQSAEASLQETEQPSTPAVIQENQAAVTTAQAQVSSAQAQLKSAQASESAMTLRAPMNGVITAVNDTAGEATTSGQAVVTLQSNTQNNMELSIQVPEAGIGSVHAGDLVTATVSALPGTTFSGTVLQVYPTPQVVSNVTEYTVMAIVHDPSDKLLSGMAASVSIQTASQQHVLEIPAIALQQVGQMEGVYVVGKRPVHAFSHSASGKTKGARKFGGKGIAAKSAPKGTYFQPVQLGLFGSNVVQVTSGLHSNEKIVLIPPATTSASTTGGAPGRGFGGGLGGGLGGRGKG